MAALETDEFAEGELEYLKVYFDEEAWKELSHYEKKILGRIKRNYEYLVNIGVNPAVPPFMIKKKRADIATSSQTNPKKKKICPETSTLNPPLNAATSNRESGSAQAEVKTNNSISVN